MIAKVTVVCDNPKHARGKISTIAVYHRFENGWERVRSMRPAPSRRSRGAEDSRNRRVAESAIRGDMNAIGAAMSSDARSVPGCNLCGARLTLNKLQLQLALERVAAEGKSRTPLRHLQVLS